MAQPTYTSQGPAGASAGCQIAAADVTLRTLRVDRRDGAGTAARTSYVCGPGVRHRLIATPSHRPTLPLGSYGTASVDSQAEGNSAELKATFGYPVGSSWFDDYKVATAPDATSASPLSTTLAETGGDTFRLSLLAGTISNACTSGRPLLVHLEVESRVSCAYTTTTVTSATSLSWSAEPYLETSW